MIAALNDPAAYHELPDSEREALVGWIRSVLEPAKRANPRTSYGLKHEFEASADGFYVTNGGFKGAMLEAGHKPVDAARTNWRFRVKGRRT